MEIKRLLVINVPIKNCNLKCEYCYISALKENEKGAAKFLYTPEHVGKCLSKERLGGTCIINLTGGGETLIPKEMPQYIYQLLLQGHFLEVVTNGTLTSRFDEIAEFPRNLLEHLEFKFSFHYAELKKKGWLDRYFSNVKKMWEGLVHYSIFTSICVPNVFIGSYMVLQGIEKRKWLYINVAINILVTAVLGGRMSAVISACMILFAYVYSGKIKLWKKLIIIVGLVVSAYILLNNLIDILYWVSQKLAQYGMQSRSVTLLINQIKSNEIYLTNRDYIYTACVEYIRGRVGLPGGFGIPLYITSGEYYYAHNVVLQFLTFFGIWGTIIILGITLIRARTIKYIAPLKCKKFMYFMLLCYIGIGMTGSSIWIHYLSTIFIAIFFFGNSKIYQSIEVS